MLASLTTGSSWDVEGLRIVVDSKPASIHFGGFERELLLFDNSILRASGTPELKIEEITSACEIMGHEIITSVMERLSM